MTTALTLPLMIDGSLALLNFHIFARLNVKFHSESPFFDWHLACLVDRTRNALSPKLQSTVTLLRTYRQDNHSVG